MPSDRSIVAAVVVGILGLLGTLGAAKYSADGCLLCSARPAPSPPAVSPPAVPPPLAVFPVTMNGDWRGIYRETDTTTPVPIEINVTAGVREATVDYTSIGCSRCWTSSA
jgi:hypothetical protein